MINSNFFSFIASLLFILLISQGCSESSPDTIVTYSLIDIDPSNNQVTELLTKNGEEVGLTISTSTSHQVSYQLLDTAGGRFSIDESTGIVYLADQLLLNAHLLPTHSITVQSNYPDGSFKSEKFEIAVVAPSFEADANFDLNHQVKSILEDEYPNKKADNSNTTSTHRYDNDMAIVSQYNLLLGWNEGNDQKFNGWSWLDDVAYGNPGWLIAEDGPYGGSKNYKWGTGARSFNKSGRDGKQKNTAFIDSTDRAPSTANGGSLKIIETVTSNLHRSTWWVWYDGQPLSKRGVTNNKTDRMSFYIKVDGMDDLIDDGGKSSIRNNFHIGTYLCWNGEKSAHGTGDGCPYEGPGNQHYYHYLAINPRAWIHVLLDQHPQHKRSYSKALKNNPVWESNKKNYFAQLNQFYFDIKYPQKNKTSINVDELKFYSTKDMVEKDQNDESITSLWVGYWPNKGVWEIGFQDQSYASYNDNSNSTYDIRWSTLPITNDNFEQANPITPHFYSGKNVVGDSSLHLIRRQSGWRSNTWTRFELSDDIEKNYLKVFFAVKDISVKGAHVGKNWPYNKGDGHDAPTSNIKIIDYYLRPPTH